MTQHQAPEVTSDDVERVARAIAIGCNLDPNAMSPKAKEAGHEIPEWLFFANAAQLAITAWNTRATQPLSLTVDEGLDRALAAYNDVWQGAGTIDAGNVEAVRREAMIAALSALDRLQSLSLPVGDARELSEAPCDQCGYNGPGYYQTATHPCAARHHAAPTHGEVG